MDVTQAIGRIKGLLMIAADRQSSGDDNGSAAALLMIADAIAEGEVQASDLEAAIAGGAEADLEAQVDDFSSSMDEEEPETEEDEAVEESTVSSMKAKALKAMSEGK